MSQIIYLDNHATTACDPRVLEAMWPYFSMRYGNAASTHSLGLEANEAVSLARTHIAKLIGAHSEEIFFTSGATESNNLAILGAATRHQQLSGKRKRIVVSVIEHKSVLSTCQYLSECGWEVAYLPVDRYGTVRLDIADRIIDETTLLVSVQAANSEIGTIQPIASIAQIAHRSAAIFHCDASQAVGKIHVPVEEWEVDLLSISAHKMHGPKGIGALYVNGGRERLPLVPLIHGGGQEGKLRSGTLPVPLIVGFGEACNLSRDFIDRQAQALSALRDRLETNLQTSVQAIRVNGNLSNRLPNNSNITFFDVEAEVFLSCLSKVMLSTGSACQSGSIEPSPVLIAIDMNYDECFSTIRFGLSRFNTPDEIDQVSNGLLEGWRSLVHNSVMKF